MKPVALISWNVNGIRAAERKGFLDFLATSKYDVVAVQETKVHNIAQLSPALVQPEGYNSYWDCCETKKGYSGVATFSKLIPEKIKTDFGNNILTAEGRMIETHFANFIFLNIYFPNGGASPARLAYKLEFYQEFVAYLKKLKKLGKPIIFTGDVNTAHEEIDLARPKQNEKVSGFMRVERDWLDEFAKIGFVDTFRFKHPETVKYSWWDQKTAARERNVGWRIDYFYVSTDLVDNIKRAAILDEVYGSDHAPILLELEF
ncbi:MAG: exodeoxyribonuclease III [Candidatus Vogelbacteria bacterium RIFOXYD1_FULL_44_32]|uniref:Exodeoxyribonuclease III n=1 Tax=Candidatus Vogelbacteria bacterium RIFOXYD1_FULL_44_32 TaxID=1802438 RepID=A0A1G2QEQ9_9BACT|nr:MAG: exodeoxyribonuclease III [Candidatus Vogelbacteria bacterium RIFOXYD1_FULL_44_32]